MSVYLYYETNFIQKKSIYNLTNTKLNFVMNTSLASKENIICIPSGKKNIYLNTEDIIYIEGLKDYVIIRHEKGREELEKLLKLQPNQWQIADPLTIAETADALENFWIPQTKLNPENFYWFTNWEIVLTSQNISIGGIGFACFWAIKF